MAKFFSTFLLIWILIPFAGHSQEYYVFLSEKCPEEFSVNDFEPKAIQRRIKHGLQFPDYTDLPICKEQLEAVRARVERVRYSLRWLNAITVEASPEQIEEIERLPFVDHIEAFSGFFQAAEVAQIETDSSEFRDLIGLTRGQMGFDSLTKWDLHGRGVRIAVFDVGFSDVDEHPAFEHLREKGKIVKVRDFYGKDDRVYHHHYHGTAVLSCIAGKYEEQSIGEAYEAEFLLARTEHLIFEKRIEEDHWLAAMEWADREGADIISSSLGYNEKRYEYADLDGQSTKVTLAANMAFEKGMLVVNSIGNEGDSKFKYLGAPADGDNVLAIGAANPVGLVPMPFSSEGPNARGVLKPELAAPGAVLTAQNRGKYGVNSGTSFSAPLVSGLAACLMEKYPDKTNREIRELLLTMGHRYPYFDYYMGYGVPSAARFEPRVDSLEGSFTVEVGSDSVQVSFLEMAPKQSKYFWGMPILYFQSFEREGGKLTSFYNVAVPEGTGGFKLAFPKEQRKKEGLRIWYEGQLWEDKE